MVVDLAALCFALLLAFDILLRLYDLWLFRRYRRDVERLDRPFYVPPPIIWRWGKMGIDGRPMREKKRRVI